jgi:predicted nucleic acid-binding Zn ribbon protein
LTKLISNCAFHLKGSGWYVSDYKSSRPNSAAPEAAKGEGATSTEKSSESGDTAASSKIK